MKKHLIGIIALATAITLSSFTAQKQKDSLFSIDYFFIGTAGQQYQPSEYSTNSADLPAGAACDVNPEIPCKVTVPTGYADINAWMAHLNSLSLSARTAEYNQQVRSKREDLGK